MKTASACFAAALLASAWPAHAEPTAGQRTQVENCKIMSGAVFEFAQARDRKQSKMDAFKDVTHGQTYVPGSLLDETLQWAYAHPAEQPDTASAHFYGRCVLDAYDARNPDSEGELDVAAQGCQQAHIGVPAEIRDCIADKTQDLVVHAQTMVATSVAPAGPTLAAALQASSSGVVVAVAAPPPAQVAPPSQPAAAPATAVAAPLARSAAAAPAPAGAPLVVAAAPALPSAASVAGAAPPVVPTPREVTPAAPAVPAPQPVVAVAQVPQAAATPVAAPQAPLAAPTAVVTAAAPPAPVAVEPPAQVLAQAIPSQPEPAAMAPLSPAPQPAPVPVPVKVAPAAPVVVAQATTPQSVVPAATLPPLPSAPAAGPPPNLSGFGKLSVGMSMDDAYKAMGSHGDTDWDQQGEVHTYMIGEGHGFIEIRPSGAGTLASIRVVGGADAHIAPVLNVVLGDGAFVLINNVGMPSSRTALPGDKELWNYLGRNYAFEISPGGDVIGVRILDANGTDAVPQ